MTVRGWDGATLPQRRKMPSKARRDLHAALQAAGIGGPYVVAGHSYGGLVVRAFTDLYPDEVAGMALIDASHPDQWANIPMSRDGRFNGGANLVTGFLARLGVVRIFHLERASYQGLPERPAAELEAILARPESWQTSGQTLLIWNERTRPQINGARSLGDLPLAVLSVTEQPIFGDVLTRLQDELPGLSREQHPHHRGGRDAREPGGRQRSRPGRRENHRPGAGVCTNGPSAIRGGG